MKKRILEMPIATSEAPSKSDYLRVASSVFALSNEPFAFYRVFSNGSRAGGLVSCKSREDRQFSLPELSL
jgi:hypothetical protein